jgi:replication factor C subunit 2/4
MSTTPWVEKYRPKSVEEVSHQTEVTDALRQAITSNTLPHLIFYGPPGTGKTSTILAAAKQLFGQAYKSRVMELNASDERGIGVVRHKIKNFAQVAVNASAPGANVPPFKLIVLDEADSMTTDAQSALRRTMETYSRATRFCIICNYISRIIPPIASRCAKFRFKPLPHESMVARLQHVAAEEGVSISKESLDELMRQSEGDLRRAIQMLQSLHRLYADDISPQSVLDISGSLPDERVSSIFATLAQNDFAAMTRAVDDLLADGYPPAQVIAQMLEHTVESTQIGEGAKGKIAVCLAQADKMLVDGAGDQLQLLNVFATCTRAMSAR